MKQSLFRISAYAFGATCGVLLLWIVFSFIMMNSNDAWAEIRYTPQPTRYYAPWALTVTQVVVSVVGIALLGLIACGLWRVVDIGAERVREMPAGSLAQRVAGLLAAGTSLDEVKRQLESEGMSRERVNEVLALGWPLGARCPNCGEDLRPYSYVNRFSGRTLYHCAACNWNGELIS